VILWSRLISWVHGIADLSFKISCSLGFCLTACLHTCRRLQMDYLFIYLLLCLERNLSNCWNENAGFPAAQHCELWRQRRQMYANFKRSVNREEPFNRDCYTTRCIPCRIWRYYLWVWATVWSDNQWLWRAAGAVSQRVLWAVHSKWAYCWLMSLTFHPKLPMLLSSSWRETILTMVLYVLVSAVF